MPAKYPLDAIQTALTSYVKDAFADVCAEHGKPSAFSVEWPDENFWCFCDELAWNAVVDDEDIDADEPTELEIEPFPEEHFAAMRDAHEGCSDFFRDSEGEDFISGDDPVGEAGVWLRALVDDALRRALTALRSDEDLKGIEISLHPHDDEPPNSLFECPNEVGELRESLGYDPSPHLLKDFFSAFYDDEARVQALVLLATKGTPILRASDVEGEVALLRRDMFDSSQDRGLVADRLGQLGAPGESALLAFAEGDDEDVAWIAWWGLALAAKRAPLSAPTLERAQAYCDSDAKENLREMAKKAIDAGNAPAPTG